MKSFRQLFSVLSVMAFSATPALAQATTQAVSPFPDLGIGLIMIGAGLGIGLIGSKAVDSMARQPEVADKIQGAMLVSAALIEGATFFAILMAFLNAA